MQTLSSAIRSTHIKRQLDEFAAHRDARMIVVAAASRIVAASVQLRAMRLDELGARLQGGDGHMNNARLGPFTRRNAYDVIDGLKSCVYLLIYSRVKH